MLTIDLLTTAAACAAAVPLYRWADRRVGAGGENVLGPLGGRSVGLLGGGLVGAGLGCLAAGPWGASIGLFWAPYRSLDFKRGAAVPTTARERRNAVLRHMIAVLAAVPVYWLGGPAIVTGVLMAAYATRASYLAFGLGDELVWRQEHGLPWDSEVNANAERQRGTAYGAAAGFIWAIAFALENL